MNFLHLLKALSNPTAYYYSNPTINLEDLEKEEQTYKKGKMETKVTTYFHEDGSPACTITSSWHVENKKDKELKELQKQLEQAVEKEDYLLAAEIKKKREVLEKE